MPCWLGGGGVREAGQGLGWGGVGGSNVCRIFVVFNAYKKKKNGVFWRMPGGRGGRPRALVAGEGWGGRRVPRKRSKSREGVRVQGLRLRGVGGRGTGPRDRANFASCVVFLF